MWAARRRLFYISCVVLFFLSIAIVIYAVYVYKPPTCFDGIQNNAEEGIDCGGGCQLVCSFSVTDLNVRWARAFEVGAGVYNFAAVIENPNLDKKTVIPYYFRAYDEDNLLITETFGSVELDPAEITAVFEPSVSTGTRKIDRVFIEFDTQAQWIFSERIDPPLISDGFSIASTDSFPRLEATVRNMTNEPVRGATIVAILYDENDNVYQSSRTFVDYIAAQDRARAYFTWRKPFEEKIKSVDIFIEPAGSTGILE